MQSAGNELASESVCFDFRISGLKIGGELPVGQLKNY